MLIEHQFADKICEELMQVWQRHRREIQPVGRLLSPADFCPAHTQNTEVLVGQRPTLDHLNQGYFMPRDAHVRKILDAVFSDTNSNSELQVINEVPVVWITGGSGVGKSVLLLHVLRQFVTSFDLPVNLIEKSPLIELPAAIRYWAKMNYQRFLRSMISSHPTCATNVCGRM